MPSKIENLQKELKNGLAIISRIWDQKTKSGVTSICAADIEDDGNIEIIACSREGRVYLFSNTGELRWKRIIGTKTWVGTVAISNRLINGKRDTRIIVGTQDGRVYILDKDGKTITKDGRTLSYDKKEDRALNQEEDVQSYWYQTPGHVIRQIYVDPQQPSKVIIGSEDCHAHQIDIDTGELIWTFPTKGWVRAISSCDIDGDGNKEILIGSVDRNLYILNQQGKLIREPYSLTYPIYTIQGADIDNDNQIEILVTTYNKDLIALTYNKASGNIEKKWHKQFGGRLRTLCITDFGEDGHIEIVAGSDDKYLYILDAQGNIIWRNNRRTSIYSVCSADLDNDGLPELVIGTNQYAVLALRINLRSGVEKIEKKISQHYRQLGKPRLETLVSLNKRERRLLGEILNLDTPRLVTLDEAIEQINATEYEQALTTLLKLEQQKVEPIWHKKIPGNIHSICLRDNVNIRKREVIVATFDNAIHAFHPNGLKAWSIDLNDLPEWHGNIEDIQTGFIYQNKQEEIVLRSSHSRLYVLDTQGKERSLHLIDDQVSCFSFSGHDKQGQSEVILASDNKLSVYSNGLNNPPQLVIPIQEEAQIVRFFKSIEEITPEFLIAQKTSIHAYLRNGECLWSYAIPSRIRALEIKDINEDGKKEILVGSEDNNIHVLHSSGSLLWRYVLDQGALTIDAITAGASSEAEIFVGCADRNLYVFSGEGDIHWTYQARDRILAVRVGDIDGEDDIEIAIGSEADLELLHVVDTQQIRERIDDCWTEWSQQNLSSRGSEALLRDSNAHPLLQAFILKKLFEQNLKIPGAIDVDQIVKKGPLEIRKGLVSLIPTLSVSNKPGARELLRLLWTDTELDVRNTIIENLPRLMQTDWETGFYYMKLTITENPNPSNRLQRRLAVRKLYQLIEDADKKPIRQRREIFGLLLTAAQDNDSTWIRQEAARTLAHFLNQHHKNLIVYIHLFIAKGLDQAILQQMAQSTDNVLVKDYIKAVLPLLSKLREEEVYAHLQQMIQAQKLATHLIYGRDIHAIYREFLRLFTFDSIEDIATYECSLNLAMFHKKNQYAPIVLAIFEHLSIFVGRPLKIYFQRESINDRWASLDEGLKAIEQAEKYLEQQFLQTLLDEPLTNMPDRRIFLLLLKKWRKLVQEQWKELRGTAEIKVELTTREAANEEQVSIWLTATNTGRISGTDLKITLLYSDFFNIVGKNTFERDVLSPGDESIAEFTLKPLRQQLNLKFDIAYNDTDRNAKIETYEDCLMLQEHIQSFHPIPNPYSTGTPIHNSNMFYGREEDMAVLEDNLTRSVQSVIVLYGQRRSGKTTLLIQLARSSVLARHIPVIIDMQRISYDLTIESFLWKIADPIIQELKRKDIILAAPEKKDFSEDPTYTFSNFLNHVEEHLKERKLIVMIDEFEKLEDKVTEGVLKPEIFEYLRDLVQYHPSINFLFAGTHKITEYTKWYSSIFFNTALHYPLSRLSPSGAEDLITRPIADSLEYEPVAVKKIRQLTADQPYLIHLMCRGIVDHCNERKKNYVTINDVNSVLRKVMQTGRYHFEWLWDQFKSEEQVALVALAEGGQEEGRWLSFSEIEEIYRNHHLDYTYEHILRNLKTLIDADIVEDRQEDFRDSFLNTPRFKIPVGLTRRWLLGEHPLTLMRKEIQR